MKPQVNRKWRKKTPKVHKGNGEKRIENKERKMLDKELASVK